MGSPKKPPCSIEVHGPYQRSSRRWLRPVAIIFLLALVVIIASLIITIAVILNMQSQPPYCDSGLTSSGRDMEQPGIFNDLTPSEMRAVRDFLLRDKKLGLTPADSATVNSSYIFMIDLQVPLKSAVLGYADGGRRKPGRAAIAVLYRGDQQPPRVEEHIVGPLPTPTYHRRATNPAYTRTMVPFTSRPVDSVERRELRALLKRATRGLRVLLQESYGLSYHDCNLGPDCMMLVDLPPRTVVDWNKLPGVAVRVESLKGFKGHESGDRKSWMWGYRQVEGAPLHPLGFAVQVDHASADVSEWSVTRVVYNGQMFYEIDDLIERYNEDSVRKLRLFMDDYDRGFSTYERRGPDRFDSPGRGPRLVETEGRRFTVDGQFVTYFGWSFNFRSRCVTGLQLFDVNFQDGRIAYEVSLQELATFYSGHSPEISTMAFYGSSYLIGASSHELVPGVDCPSTAHFVDSFHFVDAVSPRRYKHSVCVFEHSASTPLRRHYTASRDGRDSFRYYGGVVATSLVVRTIAVIWSKDYIFDYVFHLDGTLEIKVSSTGYLQTSYSLPRERPFGNVVHEDIVGNAYQELFHFKMDLDIAGSSNRYKTEEVYAERETDFWYPTRNKTTMMRRRATVVETERDGLWRRDVSPRLQHVFYNHKLFNKYKSTRGYRLIHESPTDFVLKDSRVARAAGWAKLPLAVTKYKDIEETSSSLYAGGDPWDPVLDFGRYVEDNNTIVDADLVLWATLGGVVVPCAEDVPSPTTTTHSYRLLLTPHNYFNVGPSAVVSDAVHMKRKVGVGGSGGGDGKEEEDVGEVEVDSFGTSRQESRCLQKELGLSDFSGRVTDVES